ncbi:MAG TPA: bifunctional helix-turn-helix transcriptional regulator/GNAT family N-acetyltransferase [Stellaceae bacterium]|jgi:DNA-binding MarR family transcriptional regulator/GNAT superfamily N-acetyltransferase|nr:bifunctional helix-turn-helix transcriptional regulator/GNAT family N-acetyltransferase [Stellaceae bacterium]
MNASPLDRRIAAIRRFNRFYTQKLGVLSEAFLNTPFSLTEARVLHALAHRDGATATWLGRELDLDPGYLSRILRDFERQGLILRNPSLQDGRQTLISLTPDGREAFAPLDRASQSEIGNLLAPLAEADQDRLVAAMRAISGLLGDAQEAGAAFILRPHRPGDMGWVASRHGALYNEEYGLNHKMEAYVADVVAKFLRELDPGREHCWIAEQDGAPVGSVMLVRENDEVARLRMLIVEPKARGFGVGRRLVEECIRFARQAGYREVTLWTHSILTAARRIYASVGFEIVETETHDEFGPELLGETWTLRL